jgi:hypothetical protein
MHYHHLTAPAGLYLDCVRIVDKVTGHVFDKSLQLFHGGFPLMTSPPAGPYRQTGHRKRVASSRIEMLRKSTVLSSLVLFLFGGFGFFVCGDLFGFRFRGFLARCLRFGLARLCYGFGLLCRCGCLALITRQHAALYQQ